MPHQLVPKSIHAASLVLYSQKSSTYDDETEPSATATTLKNAKAIKNCFDGFD